MTQHIEPQGLLILIDVYKRQELTFSDNNSGSMMLNKNGIIYYGQWTAKKVDESSQIAKHYGIGSKKYQNYLQGKGDYLKSAQSTLKASNGDTLDCDFKYRGTSAHGLSLIHI